MPDSKLHVLVTAHEEEKLCSITRTKAELLSDTRYMIEKVADSPEKQHFQREFERLGAATKKEEYINLHSATVFIGFPIRKRVTYL